MIKNATIVFGPPGCGKTHFLLNEVEKALTRGVRPNRIIFVGFTRKAIREAVERACSKFGLTEKDLPHFKTLHAMAFHALGLSRSDMLGTEDLGAIGNELGLDLTGKAVDLGDGTFVMSPDGDGSKYVFHYDRARYRGVNLDKEYNDAADYDLHYPLLEKTAKVIENYKQAATKFDFVDLIQQYIDQIEPPESDLMIVDEAQDLNHLQWLMVRKMAEHSAEVFIAGDDDQAIYGFSGAEVKEFINITDRKILLDQSYRLPKKVLEVANSISKQIRLREPKEFKPREEEGEFQWHMSLDSIPLDNGESWTLMTRVNMFMYSFAQRLRDEGYVYSVKGESSINQKKAQTILSWRKLQSGGKLYLREVRDMYEQMSKRGPEASLKHGATKLLDAADPEGTYSYEDLLEFGLQAPKDRDAMDVAQLSEKEKLYFESVERNGVNLLDPPKIKLSTFHAMKGGEDDNVVVYLGTTRACAEGNQDDEHRAFYVGVTRAKKALHLLDSDRKYRYMI